MTTLTAVAIAPVRAKMISYFVFWPFALLIAGVPAVYLLATCMSSESVDIALHYSLAELWATRWGTFDQFASIHPMMANYPPFSHAIAGGLGSLFGSPFWGMNTVAVLSIALCYALLFAGIASRDLAATLIAAFIVVLAIICLRRTHGFIGYELVGNYFFAHVVSNAAVFLVLFILSTNQRRRSEVVAIPLLVFVFGWLYPLGQIQLAFGAAALWVMKATKHSWREVGIGVAILLLSALAVRFHPSYSTMRTISDNNGEILTRVSVSWLFVTALALLAMSAWISLQSRKDLSGLIRPSFLASLGFAVTAAFFVHYTVYMLSGAGSDYALRKHTYVVVTVATAQGSYLFARLILGESPQSQNEAINLSSFFALVVGTWLATWLILAPHSKNATALLSSLSLARSFVAENQHAISKTIARIDGLEPWQNMMISSVELRIPDDMIDQLRQNGALPFTSIKCLVGAAPHLKISDCPVAHQER
jgi:hypothetical protein